MILSFVIGAALLLSILWAITAPIALDVFHYFCAQLIYTITVFPAMWMLTTKSPYYAAIYSALTFLIIVTMLLIVAPKYKSNLSITLSVMTGFITSLIIFVAMPHLRYFNFISVIEATALMTCGTGFIFNARKSVYVALSLLWLSMATYRLLYTFEIGNPHWKSLNSWCPAALCFVAFTAVGAMARRPLREKGQ